MKSNKLFVINLVNQVDLGDDFSHPFYREFHQCLDKGEDKFLDFPTDDKIYVRLPDYKVEMMCEVLSKHGFEIKVKDITNQVLGGRIKNSSNLLDSFRLEYTTVDDVLDKIIDMGIDSLDELDKKILKGTI